MTDEDLPEVRNDKLTRSVLDGSLAPDRFLEELAKSLNVPRDNPVRWLMFSNWAMTLYMLTAGQLSMVQKMLEAGEGDAMEGVRELARGTGLEQHAKTVKLMVENLGRLTMAMQHAEFRHPLDDRERRKPELPDLPPDSAD